MQSMRTILVPLLWAFFLMMGLVPLTDAIEGVLLHAASALASSPSRCFFRYRSMTALPSQRGELIAVAGSSRPRHSTPRAFADEAGEVPECDFATSPSGRDREGAPEEGAGCGLRRACRAVAVVLVVAGFVAFVVLFGVMIYASAEHMRGNWEHYRVGAERIGKDANGFMSVVLQRAPPTIIGDTTKKALDSLDEVVQFLVGAAVNSLTDILFQALMMILYMMFWLCNPIDVKKSVAVLFKRYILLKSVASALYALCVWFLLYMLGIDLAIVFGLITFLFNFVPEVGPFLAAILPLPVVLFDGRLDQPWAILFTALGGQVALKFIFGNIVEVVLIERQQDMKMHPVIILFLVCFFGWIWGATGMLLSVPLVAAGKGAMHVLPSAYRDPILMVLEGDQQAPARYNAWCQEKHVTEQAATVQVTEGLL